MILSALLTVPPWIWLALAGGLFAVGVVVSPWWSEERGVSFPLVVHGLEFLAVAGWLYRALHEHPASSQQWWASAGIALVVSLSVTLVNRQPRSYQLVGFALAVVGLLAAIAGG